MTVFGKARKNSANYRFVGIDICLRDVCLLGRVMCVFFYLWLVSDMFWRVSINAFLKRKFVSVFSNEGFVSINPCHSRDSRYSDDHFPRFNLQSLFNSM